MDKWTEATDQDHERFIDRHRLMLLRHLDGTAGRSGKELDALGYIESVLREWQEAFSNSELTSPSPEERTFWFALPAIYRRVRVHGNKTQRHVKDAPLIVTATIEIARRRAAAADASPGIRDKIAYRKQAPPSPDQKNRQNAPACAKYNSCVLLPRE